MKDVVDQWKKLRAIASDCARLTDLVTDPTQRDLFALLAQQLELLVAEVERVITASVSRSRVN